MTLDKKDITIISLSICLLISLGVNLHFNIQTSFSHIAVKPPEKETLILGTGLGLADLDPVDSWDTYSNDVIRQVCETLFFNNLSDPDLSRVNWLCESYSWDNEVTLRINIRTGIKFHDGTTMDAEACAWNFNRLIYLMNHTGEMLAGGHIAKIHSLYEFPDGSPVMNRTEVIDADTYIIYLNAPYTQLLAAMAYTSCSILSPSSTPFDDFLDKFTDDLIGTGPFMYDYYTYDDEVHFTRFDDYWGTPVGSGPANFEELIFDVMDDSTTRNYAMLARDVDYLLDSLANLSDDFKAAQHITFYEHKNPGPAISYLGMNNDIFTIAEGDNDDANFGINRTWRKAISYAINYTYIIEEMYDNQVVRAYSPISSSFGPYYDPTIEELAPYCNYTIARQEIIDELGPINSIVAALPNTKPGTIADQRGNDDAWENITLVSFNYTYSTYDWFRSDLYPLLKVWLGKIGITLIDAGTDWVYFIRPWCINSPYFPQCRDQFQIYWADWHPDYNDPMDMIQPIISNISFSNGAQVKDPWIEAQIIRDNTDIILTEMDKIEIIHNITRYLVTELYPHVYGFHSKIFTVHASDLYDVPYNALDQFWAYPITRYNYSQWYV